MKNTVSVTILVEKLVKGDVVVVGAAGDANICGLSAGLYRVSYTADRPEVVALFEVGFADASGVYQLYDYGDKVEVRRPMKALSKAQLTKALKAVQKQQNTLACQAGDLQDALAELERTAKPAKSTYSAVKASAVKVGDMIASPEFPEVFKKVSWFSCTMSHEIRNALEFMFAGDPVSLCLYADSTVHVLKTK